jgi:hypothetical protein
MKKILILLLSIIEYSGVHAQEQTLNDREINLSYLDKIARPLLMNLANDELKAKMPILLAEHPDSKETRLKVAYLEALGRTLSGIGPWLNLEGGSTVEQKMRAQYREWTLKAIANAVNPKAKDYMEWEGAQPLVDASFMALGLIRSPWVWQHLTPDAQQNTIRAFNITRNFVPGYNNWILFSGVIEAFYCKYGLPYEAMRMEYGVREFMEHWYVGDGMFSRRDEFPYGLL